MALSTVFKIVLLLAVFSVYLASAQQIKYIPCKNVKQDATINQVVITPCTQLPCKFKRGTNVSVAINFTMGASATVASNATTVVHGIIAGVSVPYPTDFTDACATTGIKCPLKPGDNDIYKATLFVRPEYPQVNLYVKWEVQDQTKADVLCFEVPAILT